MGEKTGKSVMRSRHFARKRSAQETPHVQQRPEEDDEHKCKEELDEVEKKVQTNSTHCIVQLPVEKGASASSATERNPSETAGSGVVYGIVFPFESDFPSPPVPPEGRRAVGISQEMIDRVTIAQKMANFTTYSDKMTAENQEIARRVLTYFSENKILPTDLGTDKDNDGAEDPDPSSGQWIGVARVYLTPLTLGYDRVSNLPKGSQFSTGSPMRIRLVSATFSVDSVVTTAPQGGIWTNEYVGPVKSSLRGIPCSVAIIPPETINSGEDTIRKQRVQDAGDSFIVKQLSQLNENGKEYYFCGIGLTTRSAKLDQIESNTVPLPLYEAGMQDKSGTWHPSTSVIATIPNTTHKLNLKNVKLNSGNVPTNVYSIEEISPGTEGTYTKEKVLQFQNDQRKGGTKSDVSLPLWGAIQVQVPRAAIRGLVFDAMGSTNLTSFVSAVLNINLVFCVEASYHVSSS